MKVYLLRTYDRFVLMIWGALAFNFTIQNMQAAPPMESILASVFILLASYPLATYLSTTLLRKAMARRKTSRFMVQFFLISLSITVLLLMFLGCFTWMEMKGIFAPSELFLKNENGAGETVFNFLLVSLFINFGFCGLRFFEENVRLQEELAQSQMEILKMQINPHFMFNVLNHIHVLMQRDVALASSLLLQYSDILRYQLYSGREESITVGQEVEFLRNYVEVEQLRWKGKLTVTTCWETEDPTRRLAPLMMITFIENAFKHVARSDAEKGYIGITFRQAGDEVRLEVTNSRPQLPAGKKASSGIGLENIRRRLELLYGGRHKLTVVDTDAAFSITLILNLHA